VVTELNNRELGVKWARRVFWGSLKSGVFNDFYAYGCKLRTIDRALCRGEKELVGSYKRFTALCSKQPRSMNSADI
jgi:hypothetical protein